jgi:hypothetical protein
LTLHLSHSISERVHYETESDDAVQYARLAEEKRESDAKAWHSISVSTDVEDVKGLPDLKF